MPGTTKRGFALAIPAALLAAAALLPLALVLAFGVCVPIDDEWDHLRQLVRLHEHQLRLSEIFERYNEHRLVLPRLILFAMDRASGFDNRWAMRLSAVLVALCIALVSLSRLGVSKLRARELWGFVPLALALGDLRQLDGLLWGWAVQSYLCVAFSIAALANLLVFAGSALAGSPSAAMLEGTALLASALVTLAGLFGGRLRMRRQALGPGLLVFGIGAALLLAARRASDDWRDLLHPRYVCLLATIPAGLWITLLDLERAPRSRDLLAALLACAISWGAITGARAAFTLGPKRASERRMLAWRARNVEQQTDARLIPLSSDIAAVREGSAELKRLGWNVWLHLQQPIDQVAR